jgi:peptidoglycan/LPS O-acetylase OafA/YrhL
VSDVLTILIASALILLLWEDRGPAVRILTARPLMLLGRISYSVYIWHYLLKFIALRDWEAVLGFEFRRGAVGSVLFVSALTALAIAVGYVSHMRLETPLRTYCNMALGKRLRYADSR